MVQYRKVERPQPRLKRREGRADGLEWEYSGISSALLSVSARHLCEKGVFPHEISVLFGAPSPLPSIARLVSLTPG